ncbi:MAG: GreA/GreB family elongation factor [Panacagrimonas sp.]|nr:GreA/GreB family elongation factor [Panacagrimonas sp.]MCC2656902.1 GreA/GreB family elongation factor [Panacagrimonas sp.]
MEQIVSRRPPPLLLGHQSEALLRGIARAAMDRAPQVAERLLEEVDRAEIVADAEVPDDVVRIGSLVTYQIQLSGRINTIRLVAPHEVDLHASRVSIISDVGAALIGLRPHQEIEWEFAGRRQVLEVIRVRNGP